MILVPRPIVVPRPMILAHTKSPHRVLVRFMSCCWAWLVPQEMKHGNTVEVILATCLYTLAPMLIAWVVFSMVVTVLLTHFRQGSWVGRIS